MQCRIRIRSHLWICLGCGIAALAQEASAAPVLQIAPDPLSLPATVLGYRTSSTITIANTRDQTLMVRIDNANGLELDGCVGVSCFFEPGESIVLNASFLPYQNGNSTQGGSIAGQEAYWDIACAPTEPDPNSGPFQLGWCGYTCGDFDGWLTVDVSCTAGLLVAPSNYIFLPTVYVYDTSQITIPLTNVTGAPVAITGFAASDPAFSAALATGSLPQRVPAGGTVDIVITFDTTRPDTLARLDTLGNDVVASRLQVYAGTHGQLQPEGWGFDTVPLGAVYTLPVRVHNSSLETRTITAVTSDLPDFTFSGLAGTTLAPRAFAEGLVTLTATTLGSRDAQTTVAFDTGAGDSARLAAQVVDPTFSITTGDASPTDGRIDFGIRRAGSPAITRTFQLHNPAVEAVPPRSPASRVPSHS